MSYYWHIDVSWLAKCGVGEVVAPPTTGTCFKGAKILRSSRYRKGSENLISIFKRTCQKYVTKPQLRIIITYFCIVMFWTKSNVNLVFFRIVGDNIDMNINARIQTKENTNRSLHSTHQFAVLAKVSDPALESTVPQKSLKDLQFIELLPDAAVQNNFVWQWAVLVSRVITKYLPPFIAFRKNVLFHIPHKYSKEMTTKSETVSAG